MTIKDKLLNLANKAYLKNEVPIAAIVLDENNKIIGKGINNRQSHNDPFGHAEIIALKQAARKKRN